MLKPYDEIVKLLRENKIPFEELNHEAVYTSEEASRVRGMSMGAGGKSLLLKTDKEFVLAVLPGDRKLDSKKMREILGVREMRFAKPDEVVEIMGCAIGACYPFGNICGVRMLVDKSLGENENIFFNPGVHNKSIKMSYTDYERVNNPEIVDLSV